MTVLSNIHLNIAGWSNKTYAVGARVSNSGNAYQCTTAGTSTSPPTGTGTGINNGGTAVWKFLSGIDYTTMQAWANDTVRFPTTLTAPILANPWNSGGGPVVATLGTPILTLSGHTTSSSNTITIRPAAGESFQAVFQATPTTPYAYNSANGVTFQLPPAISIATASNAITPGVGSFSDASGNIYTITSGKVATEAVGGINPQPMAGGTNTGAMELSGGVVYAQDFTTGNWFTWSGTAFFGPVGAPPAPTSGSITDASGNVWTINAANGGEVFENGSPPNGQFSSNVIEIALVSGVIWQLNSSAQWFSWSGTAWVPGTNPIPAIPTATVIAGSGGSFTDASSNVWTIDPSNGGEAFENGSAPAFSANVAQIALVAGVVWQLNTSGQWYSWSGTAWVPDTGNPPIIATNYFQINDNFVILDGLQFQSSIATIGGSIIGGTGTNLSIQQCIIDGYAQASGANPIAVSGANLSLTNNLIVGRNTAGGGAMISTLGAAGAAVANNTFVHTSLVTGQRVLDSGSNVTTSAETSTNNIFYNYAIVYAAAASGTPWLSTHCFYSAASFSASNNGSDAGGSVYALTAAAIFAGFPTDMNPVSGSAVINAGATDTTDIPTSIDAFGTSRPQGANWDGGAIELLIGARTISRDFVAPFDFKQALALSPSPTIPIEWRQALAVNARSPVEWSGILLSTSSNAQIPLEILQSVPSIADAWAQDFSSDFGPPGASYSADPSFAIEWRASITLIPTRDVAIGVEWGNTRIIDIGVSAEWQQTLAANALIPIEWGITTFSTTADAQIPLEILHGKATSDELVPTEWGASTTLVTTRDAAIGVEWLGQTSFSTNAAFALETQQNVQLTQPVPIEWSTARISGLFVPTETKAGVQAAVVAPLVSNGVLLRDVIAPTDWSVSATFGTNVTFVLDWKQTTVADTAPPVSWLGTQFGPVNIAIGLEWGISRTSDLRGAAEWSISLQANSAAPIESVQFVTPSAMAAFIEYGEGVVSDSSAQIATLTHMQSDTSSPLEWSSILTLPFSFTIPVDFTAGIFAAASVPSEWSSLLTVTNPMLMESGILLTSDSRSRVESLLGVQASVLVPAEPSAGVDVIAAAPIEFGRLTFTTTIDATMPLEINRIVLGDVAVPIEPNKVHLTIGARLEPDAWERQATTKSGEVL